MVCFCNNDQRQQNFLYAQNGIVMMMHHPSVLVCYRLPVIFVGIGGLFSILFNIWISDTSFISLTSLQEE